MAIIAFLLGSVVGLMAMVVAGLGFGSGLAGALTVYVVVSLTCSLALIAVSAFVARSEDVELAHGSAAAL